MSRQPIAARTVRGASWLLSWRMLTRTIGLISMLILARLLKPADFGVLALGMAMLAAADAMSYLGVGEQLIRDDNPDRVLYDTAFTVNAIRGFVLAGLLWATSGPLAAFFGDRQLVPVVWAMAAVMLLRGVENIGIVEYRRDLNYSIDFRLLALTRILSSATVIATAFVFRDYRALIAGILFGTVARTAYSYVLHPYRPRPALSAWRRLFSFSVWVWASGVLSFFRNRSDSVIIARVLGPTPLGIYAVAQEISTLPFSELIAPISTVLFSGFAAVRQSGGSLDSPYARALGSVFLLVMPATIGTAFIAEPATALLFGQRWLAAVPLIRVLALIGTMMVCTAIGSQLLSSCGWPRISFQLTLIATAIRVPAILVLTLRYGMLGSAVGVLLGTAVEESLFLVVTMRRCGVRAATVFAQVWRPALATAAMAAALAFTAAWWQPVSHAKIELLRSLGIAIPAGAVVYFVALGILWLAAGRPRSAEVEILGHARNTLASVLRAVRARGVPVVGGLR